MDIMHRKRGRDPHYKIWHTIGKAMIIFVYSGEGGIVFHDGIFPLERGTLSLIGPNEQHYTMPHIPDNYERSKIFISESAYRSILDLPGEGERFRRLFADGSSVYAKIPEEKIEEIERIYSRAEKRARSGCGSETAVGSFLCLMDYLAEYTNDDVTVHDSLMSRAVDYINKHYKSSVTLDGVCGYLHISKYHFSRKFKASLGMTVMEYVCKTRMASAENLLLNSKLQVGEIAEESGFPSLSYFSRLFKATHGMTPTEYRKANIH